MKKILLASIVMLASAGVFAQKVSKKTIDETCACVGKIKKSLTEDEKTDAAITCMTNSLVNNFEGLKKEYNVKAKDPSEAGRQIGGKLTPQLVNDCPDMGNYLMKFASRTMKEEGNAAPDINPDTLTLDTKVCKLYKAGKYRAEQSYLNGKFIQDEDPTSYTEIKDGFAYDYAKNKKYVTKWSVKFVSDCKWELTLVETNEPNMKSVFKKGDKMVYNAVGSEGNSLWVSFKMLGMDALVLLTKTN
jgi:hypothetical protein